MAQMTGMRRNPFALIPLLVATFVIMATANLASAVEDRVYNNILPGQYVGIKWKQFQNSGGAYQYYLRDTLTAQADGPPWGSVSSHGPLPTGGWSGTGAFTGVYGGKVPHDYVWLTVYNQGVNRSFNLIMMSDSGQLNAGFTFDFLNNGTADPPPWQVIANYPVPITLVSVKLEAALNRVTISSTPLPIQSQKPFLVQPLWVTFDGPRQFTLHARADDAQQGAAGLGYTWNYVIGQIPPGAEPYIKGSAPPDGSNAAQDTPAYTNVDGQYTFACNINDGSADVSPVDGWPDNQIQSTVTYTVVGWDGIQVSPQFNVIPVGRSVQFTGLALASGSPVSPQPTFTWTCSDAGTISPSGLFIAGSTPAPATVTVTSSSGGPSSTVSFQVVSVADKPSDGPHGETGLSIQAVPVRVGAVGQQIVDPPKEDIRTVDPIQYSNGEMAMYEDDLQTPVGIGSILRRSYSNLAMNDGGIMGTSWFLNVQPAVLSRDGRLVVRFRADQQAAFDQVGNGTYSPVRPGSMSLTAVGDDLAYSDGYGCSYVFYGFGVAVPEARRGKCKAIYAPGAEAVYMAYDANGLPTTVRRPATDGTTDRLMFTVNGTSKLVERIDRYRDFASTSTLLESVVYAYYTGAAGEFGEAGNLKSVVVLTADAQVKRRFHYRYYRTDEATGFPGALKIAIGPRNFERLVTASVDPLTASTAQFTGAGAHADKVDKYFEYDFLGRVTKQVLRTSDVDGSGTYTYAYVERSNPPATPLPNDWLVQTTETNPDNSQNIVYANKNGDILLKARRATSGASVASVDAYRYDVNWRLTWHITPAAMQISGGKWYNDSLSADLGINQANSPYVKDADGLIERWTYYVATDLPNGAVAGQVQDIQQQTGELGTPILIKTIKYSSHSRQ